MDHDLLHRCKTVYSICDFQDLYEIWDVQQSHRAAADANTAKRRKPVPKPQG